MKITFPVPVALNAQYRVRSCKGKTFPYMTTKAKQWSSEARTKVVEAALTPFIGEVRVTLRWYRKRRTGDIDGRFKLLLDVLQAKRGKVGPEYGAYLNDSQINELHIYRYEDKDQPRMEVEIESNT